MPRKDSKRPDVRMFSGFGPKLDYQVAQMIERGIGANRSAVVRALIEKEARTLRITYNEAVDAVV